MMKKHVLSVLQRGVGKGKSEVKQVQYNYNFLIPAISLFNLVHFQVYSLYIQYEFYYQVS